MPVKVRLFWVVAVHPSRLVLSAEPVARGSHSSPRQDPCICGLNGIKCKQLALLLAFDCCFSGQTGGNWFLLRQCDESSRAGMTCHGGVFTASAKVAHAQSQTVLGRWFGSHFRSSRSRLTVFGSYRRLGCWIGNINQVQPLRRYKSVSSSDSECRQGRNRGRRAPAWGFAVNPVRLGHA